MFAKITWQKTSVKVICDAAIVPVEELFKNRVIGLGYMVNWDMAT